MPTFPPIPRPRHLLAALLSILVALPPAALAQAGNDLPDIRSPATSALSLEDEYRIGLQVMRQLRDEGQVIEDPEATEYLQALGSRIVAQATGDSAQRFQFFFVRDDTINAFALPGGFIGVNYGLVLATRNEAQLAGVLAHEIAHVTQRHIARRVRSQGRQSVATMSAPPPGRATSRSAAWPWRRAPPCSSRSTSRAPTRTRRTAWE